jgi:hypothetical protein
MNDTLAFVRLIQTLQTEVLRPSLRYSCPEDGSGRFLVDDAVCSIGMTGS